MIKYQKQESSLHKWVVATDTICDGWIADKDENDDICLYTEDEARLEIQEMKDDFDDDSYFMTHMDVYIENKKTIMHHRSEKGEIGHIEGHYPQKQ
jgi:hypothetical protein